MPAALGSKSSSGRIRLRYAVKRAMTGGRTERDTASPLPDVFARWFASRGWSPRQHQIELLAKARAGRSVLLIAPTGAGKTLAGFLPSLVELSTAQVGQARLANVS